MGLIGDPESFRKEVLSAHYDYASAGHLRIGKIAELICRNF